MTNDFLQTLDKAFNIAENKEIKFCDRREIIKQYVKKAESIYRKIYKELSFGERQEARLPINELKQYFRI